VAITDTDLNELLTAIRAGGDIDILSARSDDEKNGLQQVRVFAPAKSAERPIAVGLVGSRAASAVFCRLDVLHDC